MWMRKMGFKKPFEEGTAAREDHSVGFDELVLTSQGDISELNVISQ